jgi:hypothetical protein
VNTGRPWFPKYVFASLSIPLTDDTSADDGANRLAHFDGVR